MPDEEHRVVYKAIADFRELYAEVAAARAALKSLKAESGGIASGSRPAAATSSAKLATQVQDNAKTLAAANKELREQETHYEKLNALQAKNTESLRQQQAMHGLAGDEILRKQTVADLSDMEKLSAMAKKLADDAESRAVKLGAARSKAATDSQAGEIRLGQLRITAATGAEAGEIRLGQLRVVATQRGEAGEIRLGQLRATSATRAEVEENKLAGTRHSVLARAIAEAEKLAQLRTSGARRAAVEEERLGQLTASGSHKAATDTEKRYQLLTTGARKAAVDIERLNQLRQAGDHKAGSVARSAEQHAARMVILNNQVRAQEQRAASSGGAGGGGGFSGVLSSIASFGSNASEKLSGLVSGLFSFKGMILLAIAAGGPLIGLLGALGGAAIGLANTMVYLAGSVAAVPGLFAAAATGVGALVLAFSPMVSVFKAVQAQQKLVTAGSAQLAETQRLAAQKVADANHAYIGGSRAVVDAQFSERQSQMSLNDARRQATRDLEDLLTELGRASLNEEGAVLALQRAEYEYRKALADPNATLLDREDALHRVKVAENDLADVRTKNKRLNEDASLAEQRGVEGNPQVVSARKAVTDSVYATANAAYELQKASQGLLIAQREQAAGGSALYQANLAVAASLENLGPNARKVAQYLIDQVGAFRKLRVAVGESVFTPVAAQLSNLSRLMPVVNDLFTKAGGAIGDAAAKGIAMVTSGPWVRDFGSLADSNSRIIHALGDGALYVADAFRNITVAAAPFTEWVSGAVRDIAKNFAAWADSARRSGALADFLKTTESRLISVWHIVSNLWTLFSALFFASSDFSGSMLDSIVKVTDKWAAWGKKQQETGSSFRTWLENIKPLLHSAWGLIESLGKTLGLIAADPKNLEEAKRILDDLANKVLPPLVDIFRRLSESHAISTIAEALGKFLGHVDAFLASGGTTPLVTFLNTLFWALNGVATVLNTPGIGDAFRLWLTFMAGLAALAAVGKFTGIFKLVDALGWLVTNRGRWFGAIGDAAGSRWGGGGGAGTGGGVGGGGGGPSAGGGGAAATLTSAAEQLIVAARQLMAAARQLAGAAGMQDLSQFGPGVGGAAKDLEKTAANDAAKVAKKPGFLRRLGGRFGLPLLATGGLVAAEEAVTHPGIFARAGSWIGDLFKGGAAATEGATRPGLLARVGGGIGRAGGWLAKGARAADPLLWPGLALSLAADTGVLGAHDKPAAQLGRFGGAILQGAGIGALGGPVGAAAGAVVGAGYSLYKDKGLRATIGNVLRTPAGAAAAGLSGIGLIGDVVANTTDWLGPRSKDKGGGGNVLQQTAGLWSKSFEGFMRNLGSPIAHWFTHSLPHFFGKIGDFFTKTLPALPGKLLHAARQAFVNFAGNILGFFKYDIPYWWGKFIHSKFFTTKFWEDLWNNDIRPNTFGALINGAEEFWHFLEATVFSGKWWSHIWNDLVRPNTFGALINGAKDFWNLLETTVFSGKWWSHVWNDVIWPNTFGALINGAKDFWHFLEDAVFSSKWWSHLWNDIIWPNTVGPLVGGFKDLWHFLVDDLFSAAFWSHIWDRIYQGTLGPLKRWWDSLWGDVNKQADTHQHPGQHQSGGLIEGTYDGRADTKAALLTVGEFITRRRVVQKPMAKQLLRDLNEERVDPATLYAALNIAAKSTYLPVNAPVRATAASTVVNNANTRNAGLNVGDITINNPVRERSDRSMRRTLQTLAYTSAR